MSQRPSLLVRVVFTSSSCWPSTRYSSTLIELPGQPCAASSTCVVKRPIACSPLFYVWAKNTRTPGSERPTTCGCRIIKTFFLNIVHNNSVFFPDTPPLPCKYAISRETTPLADVPVIS
ncbi:hypothetical protein EMIT053CA3_90213 [Pseudomonas donghuensis]